MLVFVNAGVSVRRNRLALDGISDQAIDLALNHSTEKELPLLREAADIVVDGTMDTAKVLVALEGLLVGDED